LTEGSREGGLYEIGLLCALFLFVSPFSTYSTYHGAFHGSVSVPSLAYLASMAMAWLGYSYGSFDEMKVAAVVLYTCSFFRLLSSTRRLRLGSFECGMDWVFVTSLFP